MDEGVKRKLVGAGVLVTAALIVLPQLAPKAGDASYLAESVPVEKNIPDMSMPLPKSMALPSANPQAVAGKQADVVKMQDMSVDGETLRVDGFEKPVVDASGQAVVWHIQVGSFAQAKNAFALRDKLRKAGYKAFEEKSEDGSYTRVFVGPSTQKQQLEKQMQAIEQAFKVQGQLVVFEGR
ncbi:MAG: SPOR domain-containing protein [Gammaproteobacteria bacterium]|nr:SPOR domain-containing protein [Gammaproteobacteria bacterium]